MVSIHAVESVLSLFMAYLIVVTLGGYCRAWVTTKMGDHTPEYAGFLSLNPLDHIDFLGMFFLIIFRFGWGKNIPINPYFINPPHARLKIMAAYLSEPIANIATAFISLVILLKVFGLDIISLVIPMVVYGDISLHWLTESYPTSSSLILVAGIILVSMVYLAVLLGALNLIVSGFRLVITLFFDTASLGDDFLMFLIPTLLIFFLLMPLKMFFVLGIADVARFLATIIG